MGLLDPTLQDIAKLFRVCRGFLVCVEAGDVPGVVGSTSSPVRVFLGWLCTAGSVRLSVAGLALSLVDCVRTLLVQLVPADCGRCCC